MFQYWDIIATLVFLAVYLYLFRKHAYWTSRNVPFRQPTFFYGNTKELGRTEQVGKFFQRFYADLKDLGAVVGMYHYWKPIALVTDLELVKRILEQDFECFQGRGSYCNERDDPLSGRLFNLAGKRWRKMRHVVAPMFGKDELKVIFSTVSIFGEQFCDRLGEKLEEGNEIDVKKLLEQSVPELIGKCYLGVELRADTKRLLNKGLFRRFCMKNAPKLAKFLRIKEVTPEVSQYFMRLVRDEVNIRVKNNIRKNDLLDMMIHISNPDKMLTFNEIAAQAFGFYLAGLESGSKLLTWTLFELANAQVMQEKARQHVKSVLSTFGEMSYESISAMTYLDQILQESLRKYPPVPVLIRETSKHYRIPNTTTTLEAGMPLYIPVYAIHHDPDLYPTPEKFDPDRFSAKNKSRRSPYAWIPFGGGPRMCPGSRLALMQAKLVLAVLLIRFRFRTGSKCSLPLEVDVGSFALTPKDLWLKVERIQ